MNKMGEWEAGVRRTASLCSMSLGIALWPHLLSGRWHLCQAGCRVGERHDSQSWDSLRSLSACFLCTKFQKCALRSQALAPVGRCSELGRQDFPGCCWNGRLLFPIPQERQRTWGGGVGVKETDQWWEAQPLQSVSPHPCPGSCLCFLLTPSPVQGPSSMPAGLKLMPRLGKCFQFGERVWSLDMHTARHKAVLLL